MFTSSFSESSFTHNNNNKISSNNSSNLIQKRQQFHKQIRRQYLDQKFKYSRKMINKKLQTMEMMNRTMQKFQNIIKKYKQAIECLENVQKQTNLPINKLQQNNSEQNSQLISSCFENITDIIQQLHNQLINQQQFLQRILTKYSQQFLTIFNNSMPLICLYNNNLISSLQQTTPDNILKLQSNLTHIYWMILREVYDHGFREDNKRYIQMIKQKIKYQHEYQHEQHEYRHEQHEYQHEQHEYQHEQNIQTHPLTVYQQSIDILYQLINYQLDIFSLSLSSSTPPARLILLFQCLHVLVMNQYQFVYDEMYIKRYLGKFMKILVLERKVKVKGFLGWLVELDEKIFVLDSLKGGIM